MWNTPLPVTYAVVNTNSNSRIGTTFEGLPIFHISYLRVYLNQLMEKYPPRNLDLFSLKEKLQSFSVVFPPRKLISSSELSTEIICNFNRAKMNFNHGISICAFCKHCSRNGILETLRDYYYLVDTTISNMNLDGFVELNPNIDKILSRLPLEKTGNYRSTRYIIPEKFINLDV